MKKEINKESSRPENHHYMVSPLAVEQVFKEFNVKYDWNTALELTKAYWAGFRAGYNPVSGKFE